MSFATNLFFIYIIFLLSYSVYVYIKNRRYWKLISKFRGDKTLPVFGNALSIAKLKNSVEKLKYEVELGRRHNWETFKVQIFNKVFLFICEPEHAEVVLANTTKIIKSDAYKFIKNFTGDGLLVANGNKWKNHRKMITPAFHFEILKEFVSTFEENGKILIKKMDEHIGTVFDVNPLVTLCTLDILCDSSMGLNINAQENSSSEFVKSVYSVSEITFLRYTSFWKYFDFLFEFSSDYKVFEKCLKIANGMADRIIKSRRDQLENNILDDELIESNKKKVFLDILLTSKTSEGELWTDKDIRDEVITFIYGGYESTSSCISFAMYLLANNTEAQNLAFEEQCNLLGNDLSKCPTYYDLQDMKYLERVIKETLRIYPSVPNFSRKLLSDTTLHDGRIIPADTTLVINTYLTGLNPKYFPNPSKFDPDRFLSENTRKYHSFLSIPFSAGSRNCIGQKYAILIIKLLLSKILRKYELLPGGPGTEVQLAPEIVLKSKTGIKIQIKNRFYK